MSEKTNNKTGFITSVYEWVEVLCFALFAVVLIFTFVLRLITVDGSSMTNTFRHGDRVIISNLFYTPKYGDVVVLQDSTSQEMSAPIIKRIIATEGETIDIEPESWTVTITDKDGNVRTLEEDYARRVYTISFPLSWEKILEVETDTFTACITNNDGYIISDNVSVEKKGETGLLVKYDGKQITIDTETLEAAIVDSFGNSKNVEKDTIKKQLTRMRMPSIGEMYYYQNAISPNAYPYTVEEGHVFVMGDNRNGSLDSRLLGTVDVRTIIGKAYVRVFPKPRIGF